jgi:hypothetical protein
VTVFSIPVKELSQYVSHIYTPFSLLQNNFTKINLSKSIFKLQEKNP